LDFVCGFRKGTPLIQALSWFENEYETRFVFYDQRTQTRINTNSNFIDNRDEPWFKKLRNREYDGGIIIAGRWVGFSEQPRMDILRNNALDNWSVQSGVLVEGGIEDSSEEESITNSNSSY
jgi:hypothetical protein